MSSVRLPAEGMLSLTPAEAGTLAVDFNRVWNDSGIRMTASRAAHLYAFSIARSRS